MWSSLRLLEGSSKRPGGGEEYKAIAYRYVRVLCYVVAMTGGEGPYPQVVFKPVAYRYTSRLEAFRPAEIACDT